MTNNASYQKHYQSQIGFATINQTAVIAGSISDIRITYIVGKYGIDETGALKILFRIASDIGQFQCDNPQGHNYVHATSSREKTKLHFSGTATGCKGKQYIRPWSQGFTLHVTGSYLQEGDRVLIVFKKLHMQTYCEKEFEFHIMVDPFATGRYIALETSPYVTVIPGKPSSLHIIQPSKTEPGKKYTSFVKVEDVWGNVCDTFSGTVSLKPLSERIHLPSKVTLAKGKAEIETVTDRNGIYRIEGTFANIKAVSNPTRCTDNKILPYFWADLQGQSNETVGTNTVDDYYAFARDYGRLDITCHQGNDFQISNDFWNTINDTSRKYSKEGAFVAYPGYEWSGNTSVGGDHNIIYRKEGLPIYRSSHALVDNLQDVDTDAPTVKDLFKKIDHKNTFTIAHIGGRYADVSQDAHGVPLGAVEIHSDWGTFEWILRDAFDNALKVGVVANSDGHKGTPGASYPGSSHFGSHGGLTCVRAHTCTRDGVFVALKARHTYATTGARILLDVFCLDTSGAKIAEAGDEVTITSSTDLEIIIDTITTEPLERVEVYQKNKLIRTFYPQCRHKKASDAKYVKILWSGASSRGRSRTLDWSGTIHAEETPFKNIEKVNFYSDLNSLIINNHNNTITFSGTTTGGVQGLITFLKNTDILTIALNKKQIEIPIKDILQKPRQYHFGLLNAMLEIYETSKKSDTCREGCFKVNLKNIPFGDTPYYVKVIQRDGHMAWSSPLYVVKNKA